MKNLKYIFFSFLLIGLNSCNEVEDVLEDNGVSTPEALPTLSIEGTGLDFSNYIAVGPSFSAGVSDGTVFLASQNNSWPNIMSMEFSKVGGGEFKQPTMDDNFGGLALGGTRIVGPRLVFGGAGPVPLESVVGPVTVQTDVLNPPTGPFNNLGVPGARSFHFVTNGYGNVANLSTNTANPYATRLTGATPNASIIELAASQNPSFFTLSLFGGNDVLGYATGGADQAADAITPLLTFEAALNGALTALTANGAKGVVSGTPYVTDLPYFTTVPYNPVPLDAATAAAVNGGYAAYNGGIQAALAALAGTGLFTAEEAAARTISFNEGQNAVVIEDESLTDLGAINPAFAALPKYRQATENDLMVLTSASFIGTEAIPGNPATVNGVAIPLADKWVVTETEIEEIISATDAMNASVEAAAESYGIAYVDLQSILAEASSTGIMFDDYLLNSSLVTGGLVSLDGVHLTARGYAYMANSFLEAIDEHYGSNFVASGSLAKAGDYPVAYSPLLQ
jgi:lysophospholipase L1-like esterase